MDITKDCIGSFLKPLKRMKALAFCQRPDHTLEFSSKTADKLTQGDLTIAGHVHFAKQRVNMSLGQVLSVGCHHTHELAFIHGLIVVNVKPPEHVGDLHARSTNTKARSDSIQNFCFPRLLSW